METTETMNNRRVAEVFPPGEFILEELEARGWTQVDLAEIMGRDTVQINRIIQGKQAVTPETAKQLAEVFATSAELWMNLESTYRLSLVKSNDDAVARRARLYDLFPVREMIKRAWIEASENIEVLEKRFCDFFEISSLDETPQLAHAAKKSTPGELTLAQKAWLFRARQLAPAVSAGLFSERTLKACLDRLNGMRANAEDVREVPRVLADHGIRFLIVEALPSTKIDGVCFWLDKSSPVIALSIRYDRIDSFWFTLMHEVGHIMNKDGLLQEPVVDTHLVGEDAQAFGEKTEVEREADRFACQFLVDQAELEKFIARVRPFYYKQKIMLFANRINVHPGLVVGQLQNRKVIPYSHNREMLEKVQKTVIPSALTDGWGNTPPV
jgi:HTH-type transcriptional regulator / antitoxin HigA